MLMRVICHLKSDTVSTQYHHGTEELCISRKFGHQYLFQNRQIFFMRHKLAFMIDANIQISKPTVLHSRNIVWGEKGEKWGSVGDGMVVHHWVHTPQDQEVSCLLFVFVGKACKGICILSLLFNMKEYCCKYQRK